MSEPKENNDRQANPTEENVKQITPDERNYYRHLLERNIDTDCTFIVGPEDGETKQFKAHRFMLVSESPVFEKMLSEAKTGHVRVTDLSPDSFQLLLRYIYGQKQLEKMSYQTVRDLIIVTHKYQMKAQLENCVTQMGTMVAPINIWDNLETANLLQHERLMKMCIQVLQYYTPFCFKSSKYLQMTEENVAQLLEQDELNEDDELSLVNIVVHWARHAARQRGLSDDDEGVRAVLEPRLLSLFRFLAMSPHQFMHGPGVAGWLTNEEKAAISECLRSGNYSDFPPHFSSVAKKRDVSAGMLEAVWVQTMIRHELVCYREIIDGSRPNVQQTNKSCCGYEEIHWRARSSIKCAHATLIFRVNSRCRLLGIRCASRYRAVDSTLLSNRNPVYNECIHVDIHTFNHSLSTDFRKKSIRSMNKSCPETEYNSSIAIMFDYPMTVILDPDTWYSISITYQQPNDSDVAAGEYPNPSRAHGSVYTPGGVEFTFNTEKKEGYYSSENDGVFESLIFKRSFFDLTRKFRSANFIAKLHTRYFSPQRETDSVALITLVCVIILIIFAVFFMQLPEWKQFFILMVVFFLFWTELNFHL